ncbi:MAG TPA: CHAD domain-containing protein [Ramlibacter sp.]|nr:CHAD domain-containing protein [Ramlibacter sp.]
MTTEFELKLEVPQAQAQAVRVQLARMRPKTERLRAIYYDTPERLLQREGLVLRLRSENGNWVQGLKGDSGRALSRLEHEVELGRLRGQPRPVAARHEDSPLGEKLLRVLGRGFDDSAWEAMFETDVERARAMVDEGASSVEIAFDRGRIVSGRRKVEVSEIEFELKRGEPAAAVQMARQWCAQHRLWLSTISKAQKGAQLARCEGGVGAAAGAAGAEFGKHASLRRIAGEALAVSLDQVIRNASELAAGSKDDEHVHQMRVGIRRSRTALRDLVRCDAADEEQALIRVFRELGKHRDVSHVLQSIAPKLREAGGPVPGEPEGKRGASPARSVRSQPFQDAVLSLLAKSCELCADQSSGRGAKAGIVRRLAKLHKKVLADGCIFERIPADRQHRVRKRLKRFRYLAEFTAPLHDGGRLRAYLAKVKKVQDALGEYIDEMTALAHYREKAQADPRALFAVGWLTADRERVARECGRLLRKLAKAEPFWS